jgi:hypothetical protein
MPDHREACAAWDEDLSALLDGELAPEREAEVRAHVEGCAGCSARLGALGRVDALLAAAPLPAVRETLRLATLARAAEVPSRGAEVPSRGAEVPSRGGAPPAGRRRGAARGLPPTRRRSLRAPAIGVALAAAAGLVLYLLGRPAPELAPASPTPPPIAESPARRLPPEGIGDERPPILIVEPLPPPALPPPPDPEIPEFVPELEAPEPLLADLETESPEDLAVVLSGAERPDDFDVIANLEILERLLALEGGRG